MAHNFSPCRNLSRSRAGGSLESEFLPLTARFGAALLNLWVLPHTSSSCCDCRGALAIGRQARTRSWAVHMPRRLAGSRLVQTELGKACCARCNALEERLLETAPQTGKSCLGFASADRLGQRCSQIPRHKPSERLMSNLQAGVAGPEALGPDAALLPSSSKYFMTAQFHGSNPFSRCSLSAVDSTTPLPGPQTTKRTAPTTSTETTTTTGTTTASHESRRFHTHAGGVPGQRHVQIRRRACLFADPDRLRCQAGFGRGQQGLCSKCDGCLHRLRRRLRGPSLPRSVPPGRPHRCR